jgi:transcription termination factor Rho
VAEQTLSRATRQVAAGDDVCIVIDRITRLARANNLSGTQTGRPGSAGDDAGAL